MGGAYSCALPAVSNPGPHRQTNGTKQVTDLVKGSSRSSPHQLTVMDNQLIFVANDGIHGDAWWVLDYPGRVLKRHTSGVI